MSGHKDDDKKLIFQNYRRLVDGPGGAPSPRKPAGAGGRQHSAKRIHQIAKSIETFGFNVPTLVDSNLNVIAGHGCLLACKRRVGARSPRSASIT